jgi:hypothetical protein
MFFVSVDSKGVKVICFHGLLEVFILKGIGEWGVGSGKWEVGSGKWEVGRRARTMPT